MQVIFGWLVLFFLQQVYLGVMQEAAHALTQQFLDWIAETPRSYADAEAWRRSCPHLSVWEDAIANGLIRFENGSNMKNSRIMFTARGRSFLKRN